MLRLIAVFLALAVSHRIGVPLGPLDVLLGALWDGLMTVIIVTGGAVVVGWLLGHLLAAQPPARHTRAGVR